MKNLLMLFLGMSFSLSAKDLSGKMPVTLLPLSATTIDRTVQLSWATASEYNCGLFFIFQSADGVNWLLTDSIVPQGKNGLGAEYVYDLNNLQYSENYFKVAVKYHSGHLEYTNIVYASVDLFPVQASVYPNPANNRVTINFEKGGNEELLLYDQFGNFTLREDNSTDSRQVELHVAHLLPGIYFVKTPRCMLRLLIE